jgi:lipopolysaccharide/colanic/teichoic acid biosynthesis glycosyltransferase
VISGTTAPNGRLRCHRATATPDHPGRHFGLPDTLGDPVSLERCVSAARVGRDIEDGAAPPVRRLPMPRYPRGKRALDLALGALGLVAAAPILLAIRIAMLLAGDRAPFLYRAVRNGQGGEPIVVLKVRTMAPSRAGSRITTRGDPRVTPMGRLLRRYKLDELPQLWNVLRGEMALVGPRPEDPAYVDFSQPLHRRVFGERPGITGPAQLAYRNEAELLDGPDPERVYRESILPAKLRLDLEYLEHRSVALDLKILARTVFAVFDRKRAR